MKPHSFQQQNKQPLATPDDNVFGLIARRSLGTQPVLHLRKPEKTPCLRHLTQSQCTNSNTECIDHQLQIPCSSISWSTTSVATHKRINASTSQRIAGSLSLNLTVTSNGPPYTSRSSDDKRASMDRYAVLQRGTVGGGRSGS